MLPHNWRSGAATGRAEVDRIVALGSEQRQVAPGAYNEHHHHHYIKCVVLTSIPI